VAVNDVERKDERDVQARLVDGDALEAVDSRGASDVEGRPEQPSADQIDVLGPKVALSQTIELLKLAELFLDRHPRQEVVDAVLDVVRLGAAAGLIRNG